MAQLKAAWVDEPMGFVQTEVSIGLLADLDAEPIQLSAGYSHRAISKHCIVHATDH